MKEKKFLQKYFKDFSDLIKHDQEIIDKLISIRNLIIKTKKNKCKTLVFGNGGSAAIASHFSLDLTKNAGVRCVNFNEPSLITCLANDYGFENWISKAMEIYSDKGDLLILISSSGTSKNMVNAANISKKYKINKVITFTGFNKNNPLNNWLRIN